MIKRNSKGQFVKGCKINLGKKWTEEHKKNNSEAQKRIGNAPPSRLGIKHTEKTKKRISKSRMGMSSGMLGKHHTKEWKRNHSKIMSGHKVSLKTRKKISKSLKEKFTNPENHPNWKGGISKTPGYKNNNRRKLLMNISGSHTYGEWELLKKQYGYTCPACGKSEPKIKLTQDHIIPFKKGGSDNIENIQPLCQSCNSRKHIKVIKYKPISQYAKRFNTKTI